MSSVSSGNIKSFSIIEKGIANKDILHAFEKVERERFIGGPIFNIGLPALADMIYSDSIIPTGGVFYVTTLSNKLFEFNLFENK
jgi:protein-L-isoaspartate O-methyltransferase